MLFQLLVVLLALADATLSAETYFSFGATSRILSGVKAEDGNVPFIAALRSPGVPVCGSAILNETWVISTASCCNNFRSENATVYYGSVLLSGNGTNATIDQVFPHPDFNAAAFSDDLCLIKLKDKIIFSDTVQPVALPRAVDVLPHGESITTAGWGSEFSTTTYEVSDQLFILPKLVVIEKELCDVTGPNDFEGNGCAFAANNAGACEGDFGSPLTKDGVLHGLICGLHQICSMGYPVLFPNIPKYIGWIETTLQENS